MIHANRIVTVGKQESIIDRPIVLYRGDREVEIEFTLVGNEFTFSEEGNVIKSVNASHGQLVLNTPSGEHMFSELAECHEGKVVFVVTKEMIDEFIEMGFYSFQIRLYDSAEMKSRVTIPPVMNGFDIRNPIAAEDETNVVDQGIVDYARIFKDQSNEELPTFDWTGAYNKTEWAHHDVITENKMNKIEDALYSINANIKESDVVMLNALDNVKKDADKYVKEHMAEVEQDVEDFERNLNTGVEKFKVDTNAAMTAHKNEVSEELEGFSTQLAHKANLSEITENFVLKGKVKGIRDNGVTLSVLTNSKSPNPETPVCSFKNSAHTSTYTDRDSVSFYADNRSVDATLKIETSIEYFDLGVKIPNEINLKAYEINENMVIDTLHENKYSSLINYIDYDNNIIYVKEGWYYNNKKGVPTNDFGVKVNSITKIWGINSNIILDGNSDCYQGVVCEYGIYNDRIDGVAGGVDVVSLGEYQLQFGYQARKGDDAIRDMKVGYLSRDAKCGFKNKSNNDNGILIQTSDYNGNYDENINFQILNDGTLNKLKLITTVYIDDLQIGDTTGIALLVPPDGNMKYKLPSVNNRYGCQLTILNASDYNTTISSTNDIISSNQKSKNYTLKPFESVTLISDLSNYYVISDTIAYPPNLIKNEKWDIGKNSDRFGKAFFDDYVCLRAYFDNEFPQEEIPKGAMAYYHVTNRPIWYNGTYWHYADGSRI